MRLIHVGLVAAVICSVAGVAQAHPNHVAEVVPATSAWHYLLQPEHIAAPLLVAVLGVYVLTCLLSTRQNKYQPARVRRHR